MNVLVYGGAFDPLHNGHVDIMFYLYGLGGYDRLCVVPTGVPVYKKSTQFSATHRLAMLDAVFGDDPFIDVLTVELDKKQPSYTVDTVSFLFESYGATAVTLVVGFDQLFQFHRWRQFEIILARCQLLVIPRDGMDQALLMSVFPDELKPFSDRIMFHDVLPTNISSTRVRMMIQKNLPLVDVVPSEIIPIIESSDVN